MKQVSILFILFLFIVNINADEKSTMIRTMQTRGLDLIEKEYRLSSEIFNADKDGQIWIEAENSFLISYYPNGNSFKNEKFSSGTGIIDIMSASYQVRLNPNIKSYEVWVRIQLQKNGESIINSFIDGDALNAKSQKVSINAKDIGKFVWLKINAVNSQEEFRKISITSKGQLVAIDKILVSPSDKINSKLILEASVGGDVNKGESLLGEWLSEKFSPAGIKTWKRAIITARNNDDRSFKIYFRTKTKDWTVLNKDHSIDLEADYKAGDFIQFKIKFSKKDKESPIFSKLELVYDENPLVLKPILSATGELHVSFINGKFYALINKASGKSYIPQDRGIMPFLLYSKNEDGDLIEVDENDFYPSKPEIIDLKNGKTVLKIPYKGETSGIKVDFKITMDTNSDLINSEISIKGKSNVNIVGVDFPRLQNLCLSNSWETDHIVYPLAGGIKIDAPAAGAYLNANYPEECSMPWLDMTGDNGGIYFQYPDYSESKKGVNLKVMHNVTMDGVNISLYHPIEDSSKVLINAVQAIHDKSWFAGAEKFKQFSENKKENKPTTEINNYVQIPSPFEDSVTDPSSEQKILWKFLNSDYLANSFVAEKIISSKDAKQQIPLIRTVSLSDLSLQKSSNDVLMVDHFGDNPEVFSYCYPDKKLLGKVTDSMSVKDINEYYKRNWVYNRVVPVFGYAGREITLLQNRIKPFTNLSSGKVKFNDDSGVEIYQNEELTLKRYDYNDGDKKVICLLYAHDGKSKNVSVQINDAKINNIYITSKNVDFKELPFQYAENKIKFEIPATPNNFGAILLSAGGNGKEMLYAQLSQDFSIAKGVQLNLSIINFASVQARVKLTLKDKSTGEDIKFNLPEIAELKSGESKNIPITLTSPLDMKLSHEIEISGNNLSNGQVINVSTFVVPTLLNNDFTLHNGKNTDYWSGAANFDDYTGNNKKGSLLFQGPALPVRSVLFVKPNTSYSLKYFFNVANKERNLEFNIYYLSRVAGKSEWQKLVLQGKKSNEFDFWQTEALEFKTPQDLQASYLEIVSPSSAGKVYLDDLTIVEN